MKLQYRVLPTVFGFSTLLSSSSVAFAQPGAGPAVAPPAASASQPGAPASQPLVAPPPAVPVAKADAPAAPGSCRLGEHAGINETDAHTAASIVCGELPPESRSSGMSYRVDLEKLGSATFIVLSSETNGQSTDARRVKLNEIEDVPTIAPHLVDALIHQKTMQETEKVGNLTGADAAAPVRRNGQFQVGVGILGVVAPGLATVSPGAQLTLRYDTPRWVLTTQFRFAVDTGGEKQFNTTALGVGPRYMLSLEDTSVYIGGGMAIERLSKSTGLVTTNGTTYGSTSRPTTSGSGIGAYSEVGVEMMRLHKNRLNVALRADLPTFGVGGDYLLPISLTTSFVFD